MKNVNYIIGNENTIDTPLEPFSDCVINFLNDVSSCLLKSSKIREFTDLSAFAFWARKANIQKKKENFSEFNRLGRGLCFHIAPSNIPVNSVFSYAFALLAGCSNIVRLPSKDFPQVDFICNLLKEFLKNYPEIEKRTAFVKYEKDDEINAYFSSISDCRMIWGGDKTIELFKSYKTKPRCVDITFPDRYSIAIINAEEIKTLDEDKLKRLSFDFYNDTYLMDQNACSSPQLIYWLNDNKTARDKFWECVYICAKEKYNLQDAVSVDKYTKICEDAILNSDYISNFQNVENLLYRIELNKIDENITELRGNGGYFYEYSLKNYDELFNIINEKYQTITYYGINPETLRNDIIKNNLKGIDRIVPIGKAMDIDVIWDGHNLIYELSREILVG